MKLTNVEVVQVEEICVPLPLHSWCHFRRSVGIVTDSSVVFLQTHYCTIMHDKGTKGLCDSARCPLKKGAVLVRARK